MNLFWLALALCTAGEVQVTLRDEGFRFPVTVEFDGNGERSQATWYGEKNQVVARLKPGPCTILSRNHRLGFPQPVEYVVISETKKAPTYTTGITIDHKRLDLKEDDIVVIRVLEPLSSYNMGEVFLPDCPVYGRITGARPYWFQMIGPKQFPKDAPEAYPNGILFLSDPEWGIEKVSADLAEKAYAGIHAEKVETYDHRGATHWTYMHVVDPSTTDGNVVVPEALKKVTKEQLKAAFAETFRTMLAINCYRPFPPQDVAQMKAAKFIAADTPHDKPLILTLGQGVEYGKKVLPLWKAQRTLELAE